MGLIRQAIDVFLHLDRHLNALAGDLGAWLYGLLFVIVFCETGLVITPFLPGDSLLFAVGALAAREGSPINLPLAAVVLIVAAVLGDAVNYAIGARIGPKVFRSDTSRLFNKEHLVRTHRFYEKHGGKTIILARFLPIIRTFAPFVAGIAQMGYARFALYNVTGAIVWVLIFLIAGYAFADLPIVRDRFHYVILAIILLSVVPVVWELIQHRRKSPKAPGDTVEAGLSD
jgi:membrane-associated protein